jgi:hypothetical protein
MGVFSKKILEIAVLNAVVGNHHFVVIALNVVVHIGSGGRRSVAVGVPHIHDLFGGHLVVLVFGVGLVLSTADDLFDDFVGVEFGEMVVVPGCDRHECSVAVDRVDVGWFIKLDESVAGMGVFFGEIINGHFVNLYIVVFFSVIGFETFQF